MKKSIEERIERLEKLVAFFCSKYETELAKNPVATYKDYPPYELQTMIYDLIGELDNE